MVKAMALIPLALLAACQTAIAPVEVTRFHVAVPPAGASVQLVETPGIDPGIEYRSFESAVGAELGRLGYRPGAEAGEYRALITYHRDFAAPPPRGSPVSVGVGGSTGSYGGGLGVGIGIDLSGPPKGVVYSELSIRIIRDADQTAVWEGRAQTSAREGSPGAQPGIAAGKLASALFRDYPGRSGETITIP